MRLPRNNVDFWDFGCEKISSYLSIFGYIKNIPTYIFPKNYNFLETYMRLCYTTHIAKIRRTSCVVSYYWKKLIN
ncbi:hypothetical protein CVO91_06415 [Streptococcus suis]|nr:hypothetical protein CVO91_06415 [Streptococcus suis]